MSKGSKFGIHAIQPNISMGLVKKLVAAGVTLPLAKSVGNAGLLVDIRAASPSTRTIYRNVNLAEDGCQGVEMWSPADMTRHAQAALNAVLIHLVSPAEKAAVDWVEPINEADPRTHYGAFGMYLCELVRQANARGVHIAIPGLNAGTPEWNDMQALVATGLFGLMRDGGHILTDHEGVFGTDQPVDKGYGDRIPQAPVVPGAGSLCFRHRYLYSLLQQRGEVVPLVISEWYGGGGYDRPPAEHLARFTWYDTLARPEPYLLAVLPFTVDPDPTWINANYNNFAGSPELFNYLVGLKDAPNIPEGDPVDELMKANIRTHAQAAIVENQAILDLLPLTWWQKLPAGVLNPSLHTHPLTTTLPLYHQPSGQPYENRTVDPATYGVDLYERQDEWFRVTNSTSVIWVKAVTLQPV